VQDAADEIAKLDPKPGLKYGSHGDNYITPDLVVEKIEGEYLVFLNDTNLPRLKLSKTYREIAKDKKKFAGENKEFISNKLNSANWMIQAIEQRRQTMLKVMNFIVDRQRDFFERGVQYLKPLTLREVAEVIDMHESTVSRVTNEKFVQTPRGVLPLKFFFSSGLSTTSGEEVSARGIKAQIQKLVSEENPAAAHRPGDREHPQEGGDPDRPAHGGEVPRPAGDPLGAHAEAGVNDREPGREREHGGARWRRPPRRRRRRAAAGPAGAAGNFAVLIPAYNEVENIPALFARSARPSRGTASTARSSWWTTAPPTAPTRRRCARREGMPRVKVLRHRRNLGKTEAMVTGARRPPERLRDPLRRRPAALAGGDPALPGEAREGWDIVAGRKVGRTRSAASAPSTTAVAAALRRPGARPELDEGVPPRDPRRDPAPARLAPLLHRARPRPRLHGHRDRHRAVPAARGGRQVLRRGGSWSAWATCSWSGST
jgi:hypothetical protein